jgi:hypothetical protein
MLRLGETLRLTAEENERFQTISGRRVTPKSVEEYNKALLKTAAHYQLLAAQEGSADAELLARLAEGELIKTEPKIKSESGPSEQQS